jgi:hypothetical protein
MDLQSAVIVYLAVVYVITTVGILIASRKFAAYYQAKSQCTPQAARKAALMIAVPIWIINTLAVLAFIYLSRQPL